MKKTHLAILLILLILVPLSSSAQEPYKLPPKEVIDIVSAPPPPRAIISPNREALLLAEYEVMPSIEYMAQPLLRLGGMRITPRYNSRQQTTFYTRMTIKNIRKERIVRIEVPENAKLGFPRWSPDGAWIAFTRLAENGTELWLANAQTGKAKALTGPIINATLNSGFAWLDKSRLLVFTVIEERSAPPKKPQIPIGPNIHETSGKVSKVRTYQDLVKDSYDAKLFEYYTTSRIKEINIVSGRERTLGEAGIYLFAQPSPDKNFLLVYRIKKPFSYSVPYYYFSHTLEIWDRKGNLIHLLADLPTADEVPIRGVPSGPRSVGWRPLKLATLVWVEALDNGDPEKEVPHRDRLMALSSPFTGAPEEIAKISHRYSGLDWLQSGQEALLTEYNWKKRWRTTYLLNVDDKNSQPKKIFDLSSQDVYNNPGRPVYMTTENGERVVLQEKDWIYLAGSGSSPEGDFPFLDKFNLRTLQNKRLFRSADKTYEYFVDFAGNTRDKIITRYESKTEAPNYYLVRLSNKSRKKLTDYKDPAPQLTGMKKELIKYRREDGIELSGTLYLPPDYKEGERLPLVIWAYPREYSDPRVAGQVRGSPYRFTFFRGTSQLFFITQGYAVLDGAKMPVVGDPKTMNDTFIEQIVSSAKAAIDKLNSMGLIDPERVGVGGHSYGAFMTANLLAHSDLFAAGIARSGAYNRTLTPFGFQNERRTLWQAPEIYFKVSPFMHADKINEPILLIHGELDNNSGTFPIQSQRLFHALKGHGATARLVMLPYESHGYRAKESVLHVLAEMFEWFDTYVKKKN
ncbi:MAG: S9 family peptidase [Candidatus Aminicenantales bacterium]